MKQLNSGNKTLLAYIIGVALGGGNLSNPNGRAVRLRITCDLKYPVLIQKIVKSLEELLPDNKISIVKKKGNCVDISCYSNYWEELLGWKVGKGTKSVQMLCIPSWIYDSLEYQIACLRGLIETYGSIYFDRGYKTVMFVSTIPSLVKNVYTIFLNLGFSPRKYEIKNLGGNRLTRYNIRLSSDVKSFLDLVKPDKI